MSEYSESNESHYSVERKKLAARSKIALIKTGFLDVSGSIKDESKDDWIK